MSQPVLWSRSAARFASCARSVLVSTSAFWSSPATAWKRSLNAADACLFWSSVLSYSRYARFQPFSSLAHSAAAAPSVTPAVPIV